MRSLKAHRRLRLLRGPRRVDHRMLDDRRVDHWRVDHWRVDHWRVKHWRQLSADGQMRRNGVEHHIRRAATWNRMFANRAVWPYRVRWRPHRIGHAGI